jgi:hypothetical protein
MKFKSKKSSILLSATLLSLSVSAVAESHHTRFAHHQGTVTNYSATLAGVPGATGTVSYYINASGAGSLHAKIHLLVGTGEVIPDTATASNTNYILTIGSDSSAISCSLVISDIDFSYNNSTTPPTLTETAEYVTSISDNGTTYIATVGDCGALTALPALTSSEPVNISLGASGTLTGTLNTVVGRH